MNKIVQTQGIYVLCMFTGSPVLIESYESGNRSAHMLPGLQAFVECKTENFHKLYEEAENF